MTKKRAKPVTTTARSKRFLEAKGYFVALVERTAHIPDRRPGAKPGATIFQKWDAFGFADLICIHPKIKGVLFVQTTTRNNQADRRNKVLAQSATMAILESGNQIEVHGWAKCGARGQRKTWQVTVSQLTTSDNAIVPSPVELARAVVKCVYDTAETDREKIAQTVAAMMTTAPKPTNSFLRWVEKRSEVEEDGEEVEALF